MSPERSDPRLRERVERLAVLGELYSETAHEIRNLMQSVAGMLEVELARGANQRLQVALEDAMLAGEIASNLLSFGAETKDAGDVTAAVDAVLQFYRRRMRSG